MDSGHGGEVGTNSGSVALVERALRKLELKAQVCMSNNVSLATVPRIELTDPVLQLLFYKRVSRILGSASF